jgi:hypothetical protein
MSKTRAWSASILTVAWLFSPHPALAQTPPSASFEDQAPAADQPPGPPPPVNDVAPATPPANAPAAAQPAPAPAPAPGQGGPPALAPSESGPQPQGPPPPVGYAPQQAAVGPGNYEPPPPPKREPEPTRYVSLTLSPLHLFLPMFEPMLEVRITDLVGVSAIGGIGRVKVSANTTDNPDLVNETLTVYEGGLQLSLYPLEDFESLVLGGEMLYVDVSGNVENIEGSASGLGVGPFVGYKAITRSGFTFLVQGGVEYVAVHAEATDGTVSDTSNDSNWILLLNLNLGWSF